MYPANQLQADEAAEARAERADWIEDQFGYGFNSADIAADLGITQNSVARSMYRAKRPDLARRFERWERPSSNRNYSHGYTCDGCGDRRSNNSVKWCLRCRNRFGTRAAA